MILAIVVRSLAESTTPESLGGDTSYTLRPGLDHVPPVNAQVGVGGTDPEAESSSRGMVRPEGIVQVHRRVGDIRVQVYVSALESDRILADKPLQAGVIVAHATVTPVTSLAGKSPPPPIRVAAMRAVATGAGCGATVVGVAVLETTGNVVFGEYLRRHSAIRCDPGGAPALRQRASERGRRGRSRRDHGHDSSD